MRKAKNWPKTCNMEVGRGVKSVPILKRRPSIFGQDCSLIYENVWSYFKNTSPLWCSSVVSFWIFNDLIFGSWLRYLLIVEFQDFRSRNLLCFGLVKHALNINMKKGAWSCYMVGFLVSSLCSFLSCFLFVHSFLVISLFFSFVFFVPSFLVSSLFLPLLCFFCSFYSYVFRASSVLESFSFLSFLCLLCSIFSCVFFASPSFFSIITACKIY